MHLSDPRPDPVFLSDALDGLGQPQKTLPCKYFYDEIGSRLFEEICETPEYYVTRTETELLKKVAGEVSEACGPGTQVMEFGSGAGEKIRLLLHALKNPTEYIPIDISSEILMASAVRLREEFPGLRVSPFEMDYTRTADWAQLPKVGAARRIVFFPGSTLGNFLPGEALAFMHRLHETARPGGALLVGVDLRKSPEVLEAAYNDAEGVTAAFNLHLLERIREELGADVPLDAFVHRALWNETQSRIEMHLLCLREHTWRLGGQSIHFRQGETIHTENSYKYTVEGFQDLARQAGLNPRHVWTDAHAYFSLHLLEASCLWNK